VLRTPAFLLFLGTAGLALLTTATLSSAATGSVEIERTAVRYTAPETGGAGKPRFISQRMLSFMARLEAMAERNDNIYEQRYMRAASERYVAEDMLNELLIRSGKEPEDLPKQVEAARADLCTRVGTCAQLDQARTQEGLEEAEVTAMLRRKVRAAWYIDRTVTQILHPADDEVYDAFRTAQHPFRGQAYDTCKTDLTRWLTFEKLRVSELEFLQSARARVRIVALFLPASSG
jgi:hypothetical protein